MSFNKFDKKLIEVLKNHPSAYDAESWQKMKKLLDEHLPQRKKRRKFFYFIFIGLLITASGIVIFIHSVQPKSVKKITGTTKLPEIKTIQSPQTNHDQLHNKTLPSQSTQTKNHQYGSKINSNYNKIPVSNSSELTTFSLKAKKELKDEYPTVMPKIGKNFPIFKEQYNKSILTKIKAPLVDDIKPFAIVKGFPFKNIKPDSNDKNPEKRQGKERLLNHEKAKKYFFFTVSAFQDVSFVGSGKAGKLKLFGGIGVGYSWNNKFSLLSGIYTGRKIYAAKPDDYHPPPSFLQNYPILENINANCSVIEIPLSINFNFERKKNHNFFIGLGLSSLFMKTEEYNITYKYNYNSPSYMTKVNYKNINTHYFATLNVSAGFQHKINDKFLISAAPYFKIPLKGVGYGKVKLNSVGLSIRLSIHPFSQKKNLFDKTSNSE